MSPHSLARRFRVTRLSGWARTCCYWNALARTHPRVVAPREVLLDEAIEDDEEIPAPHLLDLELRLAAFAPVPVRRHDRPAIAAHDRLERQLDGHVEMVRQERTKPVD